MWPDQVSNPGPLTYESGALQTALRGPARYVVYVSILLLYVSILLLYVSILLLNICIIYTYFPRD